MQALTATPERSGRLSKPCRGGNRAALLILALVILVPAGARAQLDSIINNVLRSVAPPPPAYTPYPPPQSYSPSPPSYGYPPPYVPQSRLEPAGPSGRMVATLQQQLTQLGYNAGPANGIWGDQSARAFQAFQSDHGLKPDGIITSTARAVVENAWYAQAHTSVRPTNNTSASPSFDCTDVLSVTERQICRHADLAALDRDVAQAFARERAAGQADGTLQMSQREWLARRNACGSNVACLRHSMEERLSTLDSPSAAIAAAPLAATITAPPPVATADATSQARPIVVPTPVAPVAAPAPVRQAPRSLIGEWEGNYSCGSVSGDSFDLVITATNDGMLSGIFRFDVPGKPGQSGRFKLMGIPAGGDGQFTLAPTEWIERPPGFATVGLTGQVTANDLSVAGSLLGCNSSSFEAHRKNASALIQAAVPAPTPPEPGGPLEGVWRGAITCANRQSALTFPLTIAVSQQGSALAALVTEEVLERRGETTQQESVFLSRTPDGGSPLDMRLALDGKVHGALPRSLTLDASSGAISAEMYMPGCTTAVTKQQAALPRIGGSVTAALVGSWATVSPDAVRGNPRFGLMRTTTMLLEFRSANGELYGQIRANYPVGKPADEQDRLVANLRPLLATEDGRIGFVITRRIVADGAFDPAVQSPGNPLVHGALLLVQPPSAAQPNLEVALSSDRGFSPEPNILFERQSEGGAQAIATGGPRLPLPAAFGGRIGQARSLKEQCDVLADWGRVLISRPDAMSRPVDQLQREALPLFENDSFIPVFGQPYIAFAAQQRTPIFYLLQRDCPQKLKMQELAHYDLSSPWTAQPEGSFGFAAVTTKLVERHDAQDRVAAAIERLRTLPETPEGRAELDEILHSTTPLNELLSEKEREPFPSAIAANRTRIQNGMLRVRIVGVDRLPDTTAGLDQLRTLLSDVAKSELPQAEQAEATHALAHRGQSIMRTMLAEARDQADKAPVSLAGLADVTRTARTMIRLNAQADPRMAVPATELEPLLRRRQEIMADSSVNQAFQKALLDVAQSGDPDAIRRTMGQYLEPDDNIGAYRQAVQLATRQSEEQRQKLAMAQDQPDADSSGSSTSAGNGQSSSGEPTAREMEAAVSNIAQGLNAGQEELSDRCQRRQFQNDPALALMCLAQMGAGGPMHVGVSNFRKIACEKAEGQPGYVCDYSFGVNLAAGRDMGILGEMARSGGSCTGRFVRTVSRGWVLQEKECR